MTNPFNWRDYLKVHPAAELFDLLPEDDLRKLAENIQAHGLQVPIVIWTSPDPAEHDEALIDGRNRLDAAAMAGLLTAVDGELRLRTKQFPDGERLPQRFSHADPYELALALNIHRRHLTIVRKRELVAKLLKATPEASDRKIAKQVKIDNKTVAGVRSECEGREEIPHVEKRIDSRGRKQPSAKSPRKARQSSRRPIEEVSARTDIKHPGAAPQHPLDATVALDRETMSDLVDQCVENVRKTVEHAIDKMCRGRAPQERFGHLFEELGDTIDDLAWKTLLPKEEAGVSAGKREEAVGR
jgi:ParB-like chromosome segregation protein Spo0J